MVHQFVKDMAREVLGESKLRIGKIVKHPTMGKVKIVGGQYWGTYGVSNFWEWKKVLPNGKLKNHTYSGYGWM